MNDLERAPVAISSDAFFFEKDKSESILVLGVGNYLMGDEGVGVHLIQQMAKMDLPDYLDILDDEISGDKTIQNVDRKWKKAARLAGELDCLVFTADQATKPSRKQRSLDKMSTSESKTKDGHLDVRIALNQTDRENALGLLRASVIFHRHQAVNSTLEVMVVQRLKTSESIMDNAFWYKRDDEYKVTPTIERMGMDGD